MPPRLRSVLLGSFLAASITTPVGATAPGRWPSWPGEVDQIAEPLAAPPGGGSSEERERVGALTALEAFATPLLEPHVLAALEDPATPVRREALRICHERRILGCVSAAAGMWTSARDPTVRIAALEVLALDPDPSRLAILLSALRDPSDQVRARAAQFLGWAPLSTPARREVRAALLAKLSDPSALVRRRAVESLGLLGPGRGTLAVTRLLEDPEPTVRSEAATALARFGDEQAVPALLRALEAPNETPVIESLVGALAVLHGDGVARELLARLDDPPGGLNPTRVAEAIGRRPNPEPELIDGLIVRLREPPLRDAVLTALLLLGEAAAPAIRRARLRGLEAPIDLQLERLLGALEPPGRTPTEDLRWPDGADARAWRTMVESPDPHRRARAVVALSKRDASWVPGHVQAVLAHGRDPKPARPWMLWMSLASEVSFEDALAPIRLQGWALDAGLPPTDRCLAAGALASVTGRDARARFDSTARRLAADPHPAIRACAGLTLGRTSNDADVLLQLLADPRATPRAAALWGIYAARHERFDDRSVAARVAVLATRDPNPRVRRLAAWVWKHHNEADGPSTPSYVASPAPAFGWADPRRWIEVEVRADERVWVPAVPGPEAHWSWLLGIEPTHTIPADPERPGTPAP